MVCSLSQKDLLLSSQKYCPVRWGISPSSDCNNIVPAIELMITDMKWQRHTMVFKYRYRFTLRQAADIYGR